MQLTEINGRFFNQLSPVQRFEGLRITAQCEVLNAALIPSTKLLNAAVTDDGEFTIEVLSDDEVAQNFTVRDNHRVQFTVHGKNGEVLPIQDLRIQSPLGTVSSTGITRGGTSGGGSGGATTILSNFSAEASRLDEGNIVLLTVSFEYEDTLVNPGDDVINNAPSVPNKKLKGKVVDLNGKIKMRDNQVVLYGTGNLAPGESVLGVTMTDNEGGFSMPYPYGQFKLIRAVVSIQPDKSIDIPPASGDAVPDFLWLVVEGLPDTMTQEEHDDCACHGVQQLPLLPDMEELVHSTQYTQDIGPSCVNFTTPNRTLEEFAYNYVVRTSDPELYNPARYQLEDRLNYVTRRITEILKQIGPFSTFPNLNLAVINNVNIQEWEEETEQARLSGGGELGGETNTPILTEETENLEAAIGLQNTTVELQEQATTAFLNNNVYNRNLTRLHRELQMLRAERERIERRLAAMGRVALNGRNPIDWDDSDGKLGVVQASSIAYGHILHLKQVWRAAGYSLGDLLYSLPLAPGQKKQIAVMEWDRREVAARNESLEYSESLSNSLVRDRDINEIVRANLAESQTGSSHSRLEGKSAGLGVGYGSGTTAGASGNYKGINLAAGFSNMLGISGGFSRTNSSGFSNATLNSSRNIFANSEQQLRDRTMQNASAVRSQRASVVTTIGQHESFRVTTEVIANHNHCHAVTVQYFEVLRHFAVHHELQDVQECLFIPFLMENFDRRKILRWRDVLSTYLYAPASMMNQLHAGFGALQREEDHLRGDADAYASFPLARYCDEFLNELTGDLTIKLHVVKPHILMPDGDQEYSTIYNALLSAFGGSRLGWWGAGIGNIVAKLAEQIYKKVEMQKLEDTFQMHLAAENFVNDFSKTIKVYAILRNNPAQKVDLKLDATIVSNNNWYKNDKKSLERIVTDKDTLKSQVSPSHDARIGDYELVISLRATSDTYAALSNVRRTDIIAIEVEGQSLPVGSTCLIRGGSLRYQTDHYAGRLFSSRSINNDINGTDTAYITTPLNSDELRNPRKEDRKNGDLLEKHLESNKEYYHKVLWTFLDEQRVFNLLDKYTVEVPELQYKTWVDGTTVKTGLLLNAQGKPVIRYDTRSVASVVEHKRIGFAGNSVIFPVAKGLNINRDFLLIPKFTRAVNDPTLGIIHEDQAVELLDFYKPKPGTKHEPKPFRVSVPTKGLFAEAVSGACNSCEKIDDSRFWKWEEHPIDEPTAIQPISTETRRKDPPGLTPTAFPTPMINLQTAPSAPDPKGLSEALALLGKSDIFRDLSGLSETQKNALQAFITSSDAAKAYADYARQLAFKAGDNSLDAMKKMADYDIQKREKLLDGLSKLDASKLDPEMKEELMKKAFEQLFGDSKNIDDLNETVREGEEIRNENQKKGKYDDAIEVLDKVAGTNKVELDEDGSIKLEDAVIDGEGDDEDADDDAQDEVDFEQYMEWIQEIDLSMVEDGKRWTYIMAIMKAMREGVMFETKEDLYTYLMN